MSLQVPVTNPYLDTAVRAAGKAVEIHKSELSSSHDVEYKDRRELVTAVDRNAEHVIEECIAERFPEHVVLGEESGQQGTGPNRWIVDPLDGTTNYCHGVPHYGVSIAYEQNGTIEAAVVHHSPSDDTYAAVRNEGAYRNGTPLDVSTTESVSESLVGTGFSPGTITKHQMLELLQSLIHTSHGVRRLGSATTELVLVATGKLDGYFRRNLSPWDTAAAILLIEEAGGTVTDFQGMSTNRRENIVATNGRIHQELEQLIRTHSDE